MRLSFSLNICSAKPAIEINKKGNSTATSTRYEFTQNLYVLDNMEGMPGTIKNSEHKSLNYSMYKFKL